MRITTKKGEKWMSIDYSTMDGYQFEVFVCDLFRKLGFEVETTNYSNDGGIDLVATYSQPIFRVNI